MYVSFSLVIASILYWPTRSVLPSGKNSSPSFKVAQPVPDRRKGVVFAPPLLRNEKHSGTKIFRNRIVSMLVNKSTICISLNYRFCAIVQNTSLTNKLSAPNAKRQIQYDARRKNTPRAKVTYIRSPKKNRIKKREQENDTKLYQQPHHHTRRREKRDKRYRTPPNQPRDIFGDNIPIHSIKTRTTIVRILCANNVEKNLGENNVLHSTKRKTTTTTTVEKKETLHPQSTPPLCALLLRPKCAARCFYSKRTNMKSNRTMIEKEKPLPLLNRR